MCHGATLKTKKKGVGGGGGGEEEDDEEDEKAEEAEKAFDFFAMHEEKWGFARM
jgi:hypothetical protein